MYQLIKKTMLQVAVIACGLIITSCSTPPSKQDIGLVSGGIIGGAVGSLFGGGSGKVVTTAAGAVGGAFLGSKIGASMDKQDQQTTTTSMNSNGTTTWKNPNTGNQYTIQPDHMYAKEDTTCRHYTASGVIDGQEEKINGTACKMTDGGWAVG